MPLNDRTYSVTQINKYLKAVFDEDFILKNVSISGELSNFKRNYTEHLYFTLKDEEGAISCVMFAGEALGLNIEPENGMKVVVSGSISVYVKTGQYQLYAKEIKGEGKGGLFESFQELKRKLSAEGIFDTIYKKPIPPAPKRIAVVTSPTGAAVRDIISVAKRRNKSIDIVIFPVLVQGDSAAGEICEAIAECNRQKIADTIIVGRGGGSAEDLQAFNEEAVARAVFESEIPVISAVGHETDFTITDFAADYRAATPSASAEIAVPLLKDRKELIENAIFVLNSSMERLISRKNSALESAMGIMEAVSPLNVLKRGYSVTSKEKEETLIKSCKQIRKGDIISTVISDGRIISNVIDVERANNDGQL